jgi:hypothetical protein
MAMVKTTVYLHSDKESMREIGKELGLKENALGEFCYCCYEVGIEIEVDTETGEYTYLGVE